MAEQRSLAHPDWPYRGTAHEWRGFVKDESKDKPVFKETWAQAASAAASQSRDHFVEAVRGIYQKQNFGPGLD